MPHLVVGGHICINTYIYMHVMIYVMIYVCNIWNRYVCIDSSVGVCAVTWCRYPLQVAAVVSGD